MAMNFARTPFETLSGNIRQAIEPKLERRVIRRRQHIFRDKDSPRGLFWLRSGVALFYKFAEQGRYGIATPVYWGMWGATSQLDGSYHASLVAASDCQVDVLTPENADRFEDFDQMSRLVSAWSADDFKLVIAYLGVVNTPNAETRLFGFFNLVYQNALRSNFWDLSGGKPHIPWPFSMTQVADFTGLSRPHASKTVNRMVADGKLVLRNRKLAVLAPPPAGARVESQRKTSRD